MIMPAAETLNAFSVRNVSLMRGRNQVLKDVSLFLSPGECVAIVGPNGAGKSSLLKIFSGDLSPQSGGVSLNETPLASWNRGELARRRAILPQQSELLFPFPVRDVVLMGRAPHHEGAEMAEDYRIADEAMEATDILEFQDRPYDQLSGGEKQRVQLARVLAQVWPESTVSGGFLLLDEPTSSLDLFHQHVFLQTVRRFARAGLGVLVVLHDLNLAMQYADRVMVLYHGHSMVCDTPEKALVPSLIREVFQIEARLLKEPKLPRPILVLLGSGG
jgi:iron complex transport system ATP-binding protein